MQVNVLWTGREYYSLENCLVEISDAGAEINSTIVGLYNEIIYKADYCIKVNEHWETIFAELCCRHNDIMQHITLERDRDGWIYNGRKAEEFSTCTDIDIPLTPFTNTLPINRLKLDHNAQQEIRVIYCDLLERQLKPVSQRYTRLTKTEYHYENVPNDFEATIRVDEFGLVVDYPELFVRTATARIC